MTPEITVVVPTHRRPGPLARLLEELAAREDGTAAFEVVVAVDGPDPEAEAVVRAAASAVPLRPLVLPRRGQAAARNAAAAAASAPYLLFLDDDVIPSAPVVSLHLEAQRRHGGVVAIGRLDQRITPRADWFTRAFAARWASHYERLAGRAGWADAYSGNLSAPREAILAAGGFVEDLRCADAELALRLARQGLRVVYVPDAAGIHDDEKPSAVLLRERIRQGREAVELSRRHPEARTGLLGGYGEAPRRELAVRRAALAARVSPQLLLLAGRLLPDGRYRESWYDVVANHAFWLGVRREASRDLWRRLTTPIAVLLYHAFAPDGEAAGRFVVTRRRFAAQMRLLRALRYRVVPFGTLVETLRRNELPPPRTIAVTIDDGYLDNHDVAAPILRRLGLPATVFVVAGKVGGRNDWDPGGDLEGRPLMAWEHLRRLRQDGIEVGAHTCTHPALSCLPREQARRELVDSRAVLERGLGEEIRVAAYPYGRYDETVVGLAREAGYTGAATARPAFVRPSGDVLEIDRIEVKGGDSLLSFLRKLRRGG